MKIAIAALVVTLALIAIAPAGEARPLPDTGCTPYVNEHYIAVVCTDPVRGCVLVNLDGQQRYCAP